MPEGMMSRGETNKLVSTMDDSDMLEPTNDKAMNGMYNNQDMEAFFWRESNENQIVKGS